LTGSGDENGGEHPMMVNGMGCGGMGVVGAVVGGLLALALLALLVLGIVWLARHLRPPHPSNSAETHRPEALEVLRREYASGRLDRDEFLGRYEDLMTRP
jgi:uncharacterized membrane protein